MQWRPSCSVGAIVGGVKSHREPPKATGRFAGGEDSEKLGIKRRGPALCRPSSYFALLAATRHFAEQYF